MKLDVNQREKAMALYGVDIGYVTVLLDGDPIMGVIKLDLENGMLIHMVGGDPSRFAIDAKRGSFLYADKIGKIELLLKEDKHGEWPHGLPRTEARIVGPDPRRFRDEQKRIVKSWRDAGAKRRKRSDAGCERGVESGGGSGDSLG